MVSTKEISPTPQSVSNVSHRPVDASVQIDNANNKMSASTTAATSSSKSNNPNNNPSTPTSTPKPNPTTSTPTAKTPTTPTTPAGQNVSKEEILGKTKIVVQGLEALRTEHNAILSTLRLTPDLEEGKGDSSGDETTNFAEEKKSMLARSLEMIELGLGEAQVMVALSGHLQTVEAEKKKLRAQVKCLGERLRDLRVETEGICRDRFTGTCDCFAHTVRKFIIGF